MSRRSLLGLLLLTTLVAVGCASTIPETIFQPRDAPGVQSFFRNGQAIGAIYSDSVLALAHIEPEQVQSGPGSPASTHVLLWLLVQNRSSKPMLVEPLKFASVRVEALHTDQIKPKRDPGGYTYGGTPDRPFDLIPVSPTTILAKISDAQACAQIVNSIGATLEAAAQRPTTATTTTGTGTTQYTTTVNDV